MINALILKFTHVPAIR